jgi:hypothetical protein
MRLIGARGQQLIDDYYDNSGSITTGATPQLMLPARKACSHLVIVNNSSGNLVIQFGVRPSTCSISNGAVSSVSVVDAGFGFTYTPSVFFLGGGNNGDPTMTVGVTAPDWPSPNNPAQGRAVLTSGSISSITLDYAGSGYLSAPYVFIQPDRRDATGVGVPSASIGITIAAGGSYILNGTACPTSAIAIWGATTGQSYTVKWMP